MLTHMHADTNLGILTQMHICNAIHTSHMLAHKKLQMHLCVQEYEKTHDLIDKCVSYTWMHKHTHTHINFDIGVHAHMHMDAHTYAKKHTSFAIMDAIPAWFAAASFIDRNCKCR